MPLPKTAEEPHPNLPASFDAAAGDILPAASTHSISWIHLWRLSSPIAKTNESSSPDPRTSASTPSTLALGSATTRLPASRRQPKRSSTTALRISAASRGPPVPGPLSASARNRSSTKRPEASQNSLARMACRAHGTRAAPPQRSRFAPGAPPRRGPKRTRCPRRRTGSSGAANSSLRGLPWPIPNGPTGGRCLAQATFCKHRRNLPCSAPVCRPRPRSGPARPKRRENPPFARPRRQGRAERTRGGGGTCTFRQRRRSR